MSLTGENANDNEFLEVCKSNFNRVYNSVSKIGYADGIHDGRESIFQEGFDRGYSDGLRTGFEISKYHSFCNVNHNGIKISEDLKQEATKYSEMCYPDATDQKHFQMPHHLEKSLTDISKHQCNYTDRLIENLSRDFPLSTSRLINK